LAINKRNQKPETSPSTKLRTGTEQSRSARNQNNLKGKNILITAGPTWVPIDNVRVISNIATGSTGILLAEHLSKLGAKVTLILGPVPNVAFLRRVSSGSRREAKKVTTFGISSCCINRKVKIINFKFFDEFKDKLKKELRSKKYDIVIHSAAVSDYRLEKSFGQKISSDKKSWRLKLVPTPKIIDMIRELDNSLFLVGFKFELHRRRTVLIEKAKAFLGRSRLNLVVANSTGKNKYEAYIVSHDKVCGPMQSKKELSKILIKYIERLKYYV